MTDVKRVPRKKAAEADPLDRLAVLESTVANLQAALSERDVTIEGLTAAVDTYKATLRATQDADRQRFIDGLAASAVKAGAPIEQEKLDQVRKLHEKDEHAAGLLADALLEAAKLKGSDAEDETETVDLGAGSAQASQDYIEQWKAKNFPHLSKGA